MRFVLWEVICTHFYIWSIAQCWTISVCNDIISLQCAMKNQHITITKINTTTNLAGELLEQCNANNECHVLNRNKECVQVEFWCLMDFPIHMHEINASSAASQIITTTEPVLRLASKDYIKGKYQDAHDYDCQLSLAATNTTEMKQVKMTVHELAPFSTSKEFCLKVHNLTQTVCSGSGKMYIEYKPFIGSDNFRFNLTLAKNAAAIPKVRFWIDITVTPDKGYQKHLECYIHIHEGNKYSQPVTAGNTDIQKPSVDKPVTIIGGMVLTGNDWFKIVAVVLGVSFIVSVLLLATAAMYIYRKKNSGSSRTSVTSNIQDEGNYNYIEAQDIYSEVGGCRVAPPLPQPRHVAGNINESSDEDDETSPDNVDVNGINEGMLPEVADDKESETGKGSRASGENIAHAAGGYENGESGENYEGRCEGWRPPECDANGASGIQDACTFLKRGMLPVPEVADGKESDTGKGSHASGENIVQAAGDYENGESGENYEGLCEGWRPPERDANGATDIQDTYTFLKSDSYEKLQAKEKQCSENDESGTEKDYTLLKGDRS